MLSWTKGISNSPTQMDRGRPILSDFNRGQEKPSPAALCILAVVFAATQTRPKFGRGLHRRGLTDASTRVLPLPHSGPPTSGTYTKRPQIVSSSRPQPCRHTAATSAALCCPPHRRLFVACSRRPVLALPGSISPAESSFWATYFHAHEVFDQFLGRTLAT
jgi:hypothetical protein